MALGNIDSYFSPISQAIKQLNKKIINWLFTKLEKKSLMCIRFNHYTVMVRMNYDDNGFPHSCHAYNFSVQPLDGLCVGVKSCYPAVWF